MSVYYCKPGTSELILAANKMEEYQLKNAGYLKPQKDYPSDGKLYILDETGNWELCENNEEVRQHRGELYLKEWSITQQIEAIVDHLSGDSTKLNELLIYLKKIKENNPYVK